jgi:hypothetical protein
MHPVQIINELRPLNTTLDGNDASFVIETEDAVHRPRIDEQRAFGELLTAHGVTAAGDRDSLPLRLGLCNRRLQLFDAIGSDDRSDLRSIELRVHVVDDGASGPIWNPGRVWRSNRKRSCHARGNGQRRKGSARCLQKAATIEISHDDLRQSSSRDSRLMS